MSSHLQMIAENDLSWLLA